MQPHVFKLAPMDTAIAVLTVTVFCITFGAFGVPLALMALTGAPPEVVLSVGLASGVVMALIAAVFAWVFLYMRPSRFELSGAGLRIVWPLRAEIVPMYAVGDVELITRRELSARYGRGLRFGAGGLWGGFGLYITPRQTFRFYISRLEPMVIVHLRGRDDRPFLLTPESPDQFIDDLRRLRRSG
jgi:hypothetical protein